MAQESNDTVESGHSVPPPVLRLLNRGLVCFGVPRKRTSEGFHDFLQEMLSLMAAVRREEPVYSLDDLRCMLDEMTQNFASSQPAPSLFGSGVASRNSKRRPNTMDQQSYSRMHMPAVGLFGSGGFL